MRERLLNPPVLSTEVLSAIKTFCRVATVAILLAFAGTCSLAQDPVLLAPTPPMGWNSWDSYGRTVTEKQFRADAKWMAAHWKRYGWQYVVIDEGWYIANPRADPKAYSFSLSSDGRFLPDANRFPSAADGQGFKPLADYVHSLGLKFGIHIIRGIPREAVRGNRPIAGSDFHAADAADESDTCPWNAYNYGVKNNAAGQAYYDSIASLYATWGVDFLKADCIADHPYKAADIRMLRQALDKTGRPIVLSLSPGPTARGHADEVGRYSEMWRISDDFWDHWRPWPKHEWSQGLYAQFANAAKWASLGKTPGHWPDGDMLPLGRLGPHPGEGEPRDTRFTRDEQISLMTLWTMFRSPLFMGGDLVETDRWTAHLLTNADVLAIDQHSTGNKAVTDDADKAVWTARPEEGDGYYIAVFNLSDSAKNFDFSWNELGLAPGSYDMRELWTHKRTGHADRLRVTLNPHACAVWKLSGK